MPGKFVLKKAKAGQFMFNLVANNGKLVLKAVNGETIGRSQTYKGSSGCSGGIMSVRRCASGGKVEDLT